MQMNIMDIIICIVIKQLKTNKQMKTTTKSQRLPKGTWSYKTKNGHYFTEPMIDVICMYLQGGTSKNIPRLLKYRYTNIFKYLSIEELGLKTDTRWEFVRRPIKNSNKGAQDLHKKYLRLKRIMKG